MTYLKRFLFIFIMIILYTLTLFVTLLYLGFIPIGMIISFIITEDFTRFFNPLSHVEKYITFITDKLESIFLK